MPAVEKCTLIQAKHKETPLKSTAIQSEQSGSLHPPISITRQGGFWIGTERISTSHGTLASGQMYVQYQIPAEQRHPTPIVMIHGGGGQGTDFLHTPDDREGWACWFLRRGYAVYVVDRPGHGRSPYFPQALGPMAPPMTYEMAKALFGLPDRAAVDPAAANQGSQWPAGGDAIDQIVASQGPLIADMEHTHLLMQRAGAALLDKIGPATLLTHSMGAPMGWLMADARPDLVKAIVAVEPLAPAFGELAPGLGQLKWGLTAAPMTFKPAAAKVSELELVSHPADGSQVLPMTLQAEPARKWDRLGRTPTLVVTAEASFMTSLSQGTVAFLKQVGVPVTHMRLGEHGQHGNGHLMMLEQNSDAVASLIASWLEQEIRSFVR